MCSSPTCEYFSTISPFCQSLELLLVNQVKHPQARQSRTGCAPPTLPKQSRLSPAQTWVSTWCPTKYGNNRAMASGR